MKSIRKFNLLSENHFPGYLGVEIVDVADDGITSRMPVRQELMAPNGYLHAGSLVTLADTTAGYGCIHRLPVGASGFTTVELKSNHLGTVTSGTVECVATPTHLGRTTQVWDATIRSVETGKTLVLFRCTQMVLYPKS